MIVRVIRYPLKLDKFNFFVEFFGILIILFLSIDIKTPVLLLVFNKKIEQFLFFFLTPYFI